MRKEMEWKASLDLSLITVKSLIHKVEKFDFLPPISNGELLQVIPCFYGLQSHNLSSYFSFPDRHFLSN